MHVPVKAGMCVAVVRAALSERDEQLDLKKRPKRQSSRAGRKGPGTVGK